jgi:hypothetical protein
MEQSERTSDDYLTPRWVFDTLGLEFDLDVAAPPWETHVPAKRKFTKADDGLSQSWEGRVWMNPPYSDSEPWVARFIEHANGIALLPYVKAFWRLGLWESGAALAEPRNCDRILFGREGKPTEIMFPTFFAAFGDECVEALGRLGRVR